MAADGRKRFRFVPAGLVRVAKRGGEALGYLAVRPETDRIANHLNDSLVESLAYVERRLDDLELRLEGGGGSVRLAVAAAVLGSLAATLKPASRIEVIGGQTTLEAAVTAVGHQLAAGGQADAVAVSALQGDWAKALRTAADSRSRVQPGGPLVACLYLPDGDSGTAVDALLEGWRIRDRRSLPDLGLVVLSAEAG